MLLLLQGNSTEQRPSFLFVGYLIQGAQMLFCVEQPKPIMCVKILARLGGGLGPMRFQSYQDW
jgi:hypothetical protein